MIKLLDQTEVNPSDWNEEVKRLNGCAFHSYEWSLFSSEKNNEKPIYFQLLDDAGAIKAIVIGLIREKKLTGKTLFKTLSFGSFPAVEDNNYIKIMLDEIIKYSKHNGVLSLGMHSFGTPFDTDLLTHMGFSVKRRWEFLLNLNPNEEELWHNIHTLKRRKIKKANRENLRIETGCEFEHALEFRNLALETKKRKDREGISFPEVENEHFYRLLKERLVDKGLGRLYLAYSGPKCVAGAFILGFNKSSYYILSSANNEGLEKAAPDLILWNSIMDFKREGYRIFNLGGLSEEELRSEPLEKSGLYFFKIGYSTNEFLCYKGTLILRPIAYKIFDCLKTIKSKLLA